MTAPDLEKSFSSDYTVEITSHTCFVIHVQTHRELFLHKAKHRRNYFERSLDKWISVVQSEYYWS